ncbi:hypothetical protein EC915_102703 [Pseudomonas sp. LP_7_YM]|nr:hypothetical protein EC915_102703 [Pseudomonas sp. LP_7_YM]
MGSVDEIQRTRTSVSLVHPEGRQRAVKFDDDLKDPLE